MADPDDPTPGVPARLARVAGPCVTELATGLCLGTAGRRGVVVLGAGGAGSGVPPRHGDLESSGIHRIDVSRIAALHPGRLDAPDARPGATVCVAPHPEPGI